MVELVIKIPEKTYEIAKQNKWKWPADDVYNAIKNGVPLPKGHGRLIDADALMEYCQNGKSKVIDCNDIARFPTIIRRKE